MPNERAAITIPGVRELPKAISKRVHAPGHRSAAIAAIAAVVVVAIAAAFVPLSIAARAAAWRPSVATAGSIGAGGAFSQTALASPLPAGIDSAAGQSVSSQPSPSAACVPAAYHSCDTIPEPTALPSVEVAASPFTLHVPILEYHRVKPFQGETGFAESLIVPPSLFAAQMDALAAAGWQSITMRQLGDDLRTGTAPAPKSFVVTLDDGYDDGYTYAYPILKKDGFVATYFVIASRIDQSGQLTVADLRTLMAGGNEIGNHSMSHRDLRVMSPDRLVTETFGASAVIARDVGVWPQSYAYPMGMTDPQVVSVLAACPGIQTAVIQTGSRHETWPNRFELPRLRVGPGTDPQDLIERMNGYQP